MQSSTKNFRVVRLYGYYDAHPHYGGYLHWHDKTGDSGVNHPKRGGRPALDQNGNQLEKTVYVEDLDIDEE